MESEIQAIQVTISELKRKAKYFRQQADEYDRVAERLARLITPAVTEAEAMRKQLLPATDTVDIVRVRAPRKQLLNAIVEVLKHNQSIGIDGMTANQVYEELKMRGYSFGSKTDKGCIRLVHSTVSRNRPTVFAEASDGKIRLNTEIARGETQE